MSTAASSHFAIKPECYGLLMSDLRGFTALTGQYPVEKLAPLLNLYFQRMTETITRHDGMVDKFMGDSIFARFAVEDRRATAMAMMACAVDMQLTMDEVNRFAEVLELPDIFMGIGLNIGNVVACTLGAGIYQEQTVLGDPVNLVARMAAFALRGQVLISPELREAAQDFVHCGASFKVMLKGKKFPVDVHELLALLHPLPKAIPVRDNRKSPRVDVMLPISYHLIEGQRVKPGTVKADTTDLSYGGMRIITPHNHQILDEIKIVMPFGGQSGSGGGDVYAKVLSTTPEGDREFCISTEFSYLDEATRKAIRNLVDHLA